MLEKGVNGRLARSSVHPGDRLGTERNLPMSNETRSTLIGMTAMFVGGCTFLVLCLATPIGDVGTALLGGATAVAVTAVVMSAMAPWQR